MKQVKLADLPAQVGIIVQEPFLFCGMVIDNIGYTRAGAIEADIVSMPAGNDTVIGPKGCELSGSERPTHLLCPCGPSRSEDSHSGRGHVVTRIRGRAADTGRIGAPGQGPYRHRLSTLRNAVRLVVVDQSWLSEVGRHRELMAKRGICFGLVEAQRKMSREAAI